MGPLRMAAPQFAAARDMGARVVYVRIEQQFFFFFFGGAGVHERRGVGHALHVSQSAIASYHEDDQRISLVIGPCGQIQKMTSEIAYRVRMIKDFTRHLGPSRALWTIGKTSQCGRYGFSQPLTQGADAAARPRKEGRKEGSRTE